jgi:hypothetical protein
LIVLVNKETGVKAVQSGTLAFVSRKGRFIQPLSEIPLSKDQALAIRLAKCITIKCANSPDDIIFRSLSLKTMMPIQLFFAHREHPMVKAWMY